MTRQEVNTMMVEWMIQFTDEFINDSILPNYNEITNDKAFLLLLEKWSNSMKAYKHFKEMDLNNAIKAITEDNKVKTIYCPYPSNYSSMMQEICLNWNKL